MSTSPKILGGLINEHRSTGTLGFKKTQEEAAGANAVDPRVAYASNILPGLLSNPTGNSQSASAVRA